MNALAASAVAETLQSWRTLLRRPGYLVLAMLTLSLGVATSTTVFSLLDQALLRPLPFPEPERLVTLGIQMEEGGQFLPRNTGAPGFYAPAQRMPGAASVGMVLRAVRNSNLSAHGIAEVVPSLAADSGFLDTLGLPLALGRNFNPEENRPGGPQAAIISHALWQRKFGGQGDVIGSTLWVEGAPVQVIGVMSAGFDWPDRFDLLLPLQPDPHNTTIATNEYIIARLKPDVSLAVASAQTEALMRPVMLSHAKSESDRQSIAMLRFGALPLRESVFTSQSGNVLWMFMASALCVLGIAAFNLGNLVLLRQLTSDHDLAVRAALGAPRWRLALPALAQAALIGLAGALAGLLLAAIMLGVLADWVPFEWLRGRAPHLGLGAWLFALLAGLTVAALGALIAVMRGQRGNALRALGRRASGGLGRSEGRLARKLIVAQVAVATILLMGASLFAHSLIKLSKVPMGFTSESIVTFTLSPLRASAPVIGDVHRQIRNLRQALNREPGVHESGVSTNLPTASQFNMYAQFPDGRGSSVQFRPVSAGYLDVFDITLLAGRSFDRLSDRAGSELVGVVSQEFARQYLQGEANALGQQVKVMGAGDIRVVGVVGDVRQFGPAEAPPPVLYVALEQIQPDLWTLIRDFMPLQYAVRVAPGMESGLMPRLPELIAQISPGQPISNIQTMQAVVASTTREQRLNVLLVGVFSALALLLAAVGLYAVMAVAVTARTHEFGIRAALGAPPSRLLRDVLGDGARQLGWGLGIGLVLALALSRLIQGFLFNMDALDPISLLLVIMVLALTGMLACLSPALRAARTSPVRALADH